MNLTRLYLRQVRALAEQLRADEWHEEDHPRGQPENAGEFASKPGGSTTKEIDETRIKPDVVDVGGDEWNRQTAKRLARESLIAEDALSDIITKNIAEHPKASQLVKEEEEEEEEAEEEDPDELPFGAPESWDELSDDQQEATKQKWIEANTDSYYENEVNNWIENGEQEREAVEKVADDLHTDSDNEWFDDALDALRDERRDDGLPDIPFDNDTLRAAVKFELNESKYSNYAENAHFEIGDDILDNDPAHRPDPDQLELGNFGTRHPSKLLTDDMREALEVALRDAFEARVSHVADDIEPPEYLKDNLAEYMDEAWDGYDAKEAFNFAKEYGVVDEAAEPEEHSKHTDINTDDVEITNSDIPNVFDPLEMHGGIDYRRTQKLARKLSWQRTLELLAERGIKMRVKGDADLGPATAGDVWQTQVIANMDEKIWKGWKQSSVSSQGALLQLATAEELGGRFFPDVIKQYGFDADKLKALANDGYYGIGGYAGIRALVRAKWETTQFLLDKANVHKVSVYRAIKAPAVYDPLTREPTNATKIDTYQRLDDFHYKRNGALSTSLDAGVPNDWGDRPTRVVLRMEVPRTAVISVPAYGVNVHVERELVVAGTAWNKWDAWAHEAPEFEKAPIQ